METMTGIFSRSDITPWTPSPESIPQEWVRYIQAHSQGELQSSPEQQANSQATGERLHGWGLPWSVVVAGYLWNCDEKQLRNVALPETETVLAHLAQAKVYASYIARENLPPLLTPPYHDPGALLIACTVYFHELKTLKEQNERHLYTEKLQSYIESIGRTLLNIAKRLNIWHFKREIEDLIEELRSPRKFAEMQQKHTEILTRDKPLLEDVRQLFIRFYQEATGQPINVLYTPCGIAGYKRRKQDRNATANTQQGEVTGFDLVTFDVIVSTVQSCYTAFGVLNQLGNTYGRISDLIANPKPNGGSHLAFDLVLWAQGFYAKDLRWPVHYTAYCQLQIVTHLMQAINWYGCLYPDYYQLCSDTNDSHNIKPPTAKQLLENKEGNLFLAIHEGFHSGNIQLKPETPILVYDRKHKQVTLPEGATALDFAYEVDHVIAEHAVEALINNRRAPLFRVLEAGDIVEIYTASEAQTSENWLDRATTREARSQIEESLTERHADRKSYKLLRQQLERYHFMLSTDDLDQELDLLLQQHQLGNRQAYLKQLDEHSNPPYSLDWAVQEIMQQIAERNEPLPLGKGKNNWVPVLDMQLTANHKLIRQQHRCDLCQPTYPRDMKIVGRLHKKRHELVIHTESCRLLHTVGYQPVLFPMTWQLQHPTVIVAFFLTAQDRMGLIYDIARLLRRYQCDLLSMTAEAVSKYGEAHIRLSIETHTYKEAEDIRNALTKISNVTKVDIDASLTPLSVCKQLEELHAQKASLPDSTIAEPSQEDTLAVQQSRHFLIDNPFDISRPASVSMFFGRNNETGRLSRELCEDSRGKALILYGPRRSGKSSICVNFIEQHISPPFWGTVFSLQNFTHHSEGEILAQLAEKVSQQFSEQLDRPGPQWEHYQGDDPQRRFRRLVQDCLNQVPGARLILALDEFGGTLDSYDKKFLDYRFFSYWKELMNEIEQLSIIFALPTSSHRILTSKVFANAFSFTDDLPVAYLDTESARQLLVQPLRERNIGIFPNTIALALKLTGRNPYYMTLIGQQLINLLQREPSKERITDEDLNMVVEQITQHGNQNFLFLKKELQDRLEFRILEALIDTSSRTHQPGAYLKKIASELHVSNTYARRYLDRLRNGLILQENGSTGNPYYTFTIELVHRWLSRNRWFFLP